MARKTSGNDETQINFFDSFDIMESTTSKFGTDIFTKYFRMADHTTYNSWNKWTKISDLETNIFELNMMVKRGLVFFILKFY